MNPICDKLAPSPACMLGMATLTTNKSKIVTNPPSSNTDSPSQEDRGEAWAGKSESGNLVHILLIQGSEASILNALLSNYNLAIYAITKGNGIGSCEPWNARATTSPPSCGRAASACRRPM